MQDTLLQKLTELKVEAESVLRKGKGVVQSSDHPNMKLGLAQSCNSSPDLCQYSVALLDQHHVILQRA